MVHRYQAGMLMVVGILLACCSQPSEPSGNDLDTTASSSSATPASQISEIPPTDTITPSPSETRPSITITPAPSETMPSIIETSTPAPTLFPVPPAHQIVPNSSFNSGLGPWSPRLGNLSRSTSQYYTGPGSGLIITSDSDNAGAAGQCISIKEYLAGWPVIAGQQPITIDAFLKTDANIHQASLMVIFHEEECGPSSQLRVQVGAMQSAPLTRDEDWTQLSAAGTLPDNALSVDVIIWASGTNDTARAYFDDVRSYPSAPD